MTARRGGFDRLVMAGALAACMLARAARAEEIVFSFVLNEAQVVPPTASAATGRGKARLSADESNVLFIIEHDVVGPVAASVQRGDFGTNGPLVHRFVSYSGLVVEEISGCPGSAGDVVTVELWMRDLPQAVTGFQAFLSYDPTFMSYRGDLSSYTISPFPMHMRSTALAEVTPGQINLDGSSPLTFPPHPGTNQDSRLATLRFVLNADCHRRLVDFDESGPFASELSFQGEPLEDTPTSGLFVDVAEGCTDEIGDFLEVELWMRDLPSAATGYQAFLEFDESVLAFRGDLSTYTLAPFPQHVRAMIDAETELGRLQVDGSAALTFPPDPGTSADALLARLRFEAIAECDMSLVRFRDVPPFLSEVSFHGEPVITGNPALSPIVGTWYPSAQEVQDLRAGRLYVRIDSELRPTGDIRGQIAVNPNPEPGDVILTEIMYNPQVGAGGPWAAEWIELFNTTLTDIDMTGWYFEDEDAGQEDPCTPLRSGSFPEFVLRSFQTAVVIPDGEVPVRPSVEDFRTAWGLSSTIVVVQLDTNGTAGGALAGDGLDDDPRNDLNTGNDLPLAGIEWLPCASNGFPRPDNEILVLRSAAQIIDVVNYDDDLDAEIVSDWPENDIGHSISLIPTDYPFATSFTTYTAEGNDIGANWVSHNHGDSAGGIRQLQSAGVYSGVNVGSPGYLYGATPGNRAPAALDQKVLLAKGQSIDIILQAMDHTRPFFGFLLFIIDSLPAHGQLIDVPSNRVLTPADVAGDGYLMPRFPFNRVRYVSNGTCTRDSFAFRASDGLLLSGGAQVELVVQCGGLVITEIMYDPASAEDDPPATEWVEVFNSTQRPIDLAGHYLQDNEGRGGELPRFILGSRSAIVVAARSTNPAEFAAAWNASIVQPTSAGVETDGLTATGLSSASEDLMLMRPGAPLHEVVDAVCYARGSKAPTWPNPNPAGPSIYVRPTAGYTTLGNDTAAAWAASVAGVDGAYVNTATAQFTGPDVGSPGYLQGIVQGLCDDLSQPFDGNGDLLIDRRDYAHFQRCHFGAGVPPQPLNCACFDADGDNDIDLRDFSTLQVWFTGP